MTTLTQLRADKQRAHATLSEAARKRGQAEQHLRKFRAHVELPGLTNVPSGAQRAAAVELLQQRIEAETVARARYDVAAQALRAAEASVPKAPATARGSLKTPTTYHRDGLSWFADIYSVQTYMNPLARERLTACDRRARALGKTLLRTPMDDAGGAGFNPPLWLSDYWADQVRAAAPLASACQQIPMSAFGLNSQVPLFTTGADVALQSAEGDAVHDNSDTVASTTSRSPYATLSGFTDTARQLLERSLPGLDMALVQSLTASFAEQLENQVINGDGTADANSGELVGALNIPSVLAYTYDDASPTQAELLTNMYMCWSQFTRLRKRMPDTWLMPPEFIAWLGAAQGTTLPTFQQGGFTPPDDANGQTARFLGLPVLSSEYLPTDLGGGANEGVLVLAKTSDLLLAQNVQSFQFQSVQSNALAVRVLVYGGAFFHGDRFGGASIATISGTGTIVPSGYAPS